MCVCVWHQNRFTEPAWEDDERSEEMRFDSEQHVNNHLVLVLAFSQTERIWGDGKLVKANGFMTEDKATARHCEIFPSAHTLSATTLNSPCVSLHCGCVPTTRQGTGWIQSVTWFRSGSDWSVPDVAHSLSAARDQEHYTEIWLCSHRENATDNKRWAEHVTAKYYWLYPYRKRHSSSNHLQTFEAQQKHGLLYIYPASAGVLECLVLQLGPNPSE